SRLAGLLAIAVLGVIMLSGFNRHLTSSLAGLNLESDVRIEIESQRERLAAIEIPQGITPEQRAKVRQTIEESFLAGFRLVMLSASGLALLSVGAAWLLIEDKQKRRRTTSA
ncbi:MAG TPA: MFS transporter, partial [Terriglobia bacterium]|nr:MFS transporter [Terriglobia bacterium]